jgi:hypothetical protein
MQQKTGFPKKLFQSKKGSSPPDSLSGLPLDPPSLNTKPFHREPKIDLRYCTRGQNMRTNEIGRRRLSGRQDSAALRRQTCTKLDLMR